jgi:hypothetical protein
LETVPSWYTDTYLYYAQQGKRVIATAYRPLTAKPGEVWREKKGRRKRKGKRKAKKGKRKRKRKKMSGGNEEEFFCLRK